MSRYRLGMLTVALFLAVLHVCPPGAERAEAQVPHNPPPNQLGNAAGNTGAPSTVAAKFIMIPGLVPLGMPGVQREIGLAPEQRQKLKAISDAYVASMQRLGKTFRDLSPEDQQSRGSNMRDQASQFARSAQRKAEAVLTAKQLKTVERIAFQLMAAGALADPGLQEKLGLSSEQRDRLATVYEEAGDKMQQLQRDTAVKVMQVLDEDQATALKKQLDEQPKK